MEKKETPEKGYFPKKGFPFERPLSLSTLDAKLLTPIQIDDKKIEMEDFEKTLHEVLRFNPTKEEREVYGITKPPKNLERDNNILKMYFGLSPFEKEYNLREIGEKYNLSRERIWQIVDIKILRLRHNKKGIGLKYFLGKELNPRNLF